MALGAADLAFQSVGAGAGGFAARPSQRSLERWKVGAFEHASVAAFLAAERLPNGVHTILGGESPIDLLVRGRRGAPLIFSFHGNTPRSDTLMLPVFTGLNVTRDLDASFVALSDPTLHLDADLRLAWYAGSARQSLQLELPAILSKVAAALAAPRLLFFGGSGGGFAALYYAASFPDSLSVVWNPQTDIRRYNPSHIEDYGRAAFGWGGLEETKHWLPHAIDCSLMARYGGRADNLILYMQNQSDGHVANHMAPFLATLGADADAILRDRPANARVAESVWLHLGAWGDGHASPPPQFLAALLGEVLALPDWRAGLGSGAIGAGIDSAYGRTRGEATVAA